MEALQRSRMLNPYARHISVRVIWWIADHLADRQVFVRDDTEASNASKL